MEEEGPGWFPMQELVRTLNELVDAILQGEVAPLRDWYAPNVLIQFRNHEWRGLDGVEEELQVHQRKLRKFRRVATNLDSVGPEEDGHRMATFLTRFHSPFGDLTLRHEVEMQEERVHAHRIELDRIHPLAAILPSRTPQAA